MTEERAKELGIFTAWGLVSCQICATYTKIADLTEANGAICCVKCEKEANRRQVNDSQQSLFDVVQTLF